MQISYHPAFDAGHALFRFMRIRSHLNFSQIEFQKLRILDFYLLFPQRAGSIRLSQADIGLRAVAKSAGGPESYSLLPSDPILFARMEPSQIAAAQTMATAGAVAKDGLEVGLIKFLAFDVPGDLLRRIEAANSQDTGALVIVAALNRYPLLGANGLKDRTGLLEHRYDKI